MVFEGRIEEARPDLDGLDRDAALAKVQRGLFSSADAPVRIGRFTVIERLGAGAMGVVYAAYDPRLDRRVAIKVLRPDQELLGDGDAHQRLLREAQTLAKLNHPGIVAVHEVGEVGDRVFVAMEYVDGSDLAQWLAKTPRPWSEVLAKFLAAGEGLAAAHAAGLVHRDFKPDNVLIDKRGGTLVADFGLARSLDAEAARSLAAMEMTVADGEPEPSQLDAQSKLTRTGAVLGTPAYMAPEQFAGREVDHRTDQFAFCVALHEGLYGERPFAGSSLPELVAHVEDGTLAPAPATRGVPGRIRRAILRGLAVDPADRWPDMAALLAVLRRNPSAMWRRRAVAGLGIGGIGLAAVSWLPDDESGGDANQGAAPCSGLSAHLEGIWDANRKSEVREVLTRSAGPGGARVWAGLEPSMDDYADAWLRARTESCEASQVRQEVSEEMHDRQRLCLDRARLALAAASRRLAEPEEDEVTDLLANAHRLVPDRVLIAECSEQAVLDAGVPPPPDPVLREQIAALEEELAEIASLRLAGRAPTALPRAEAAATAADALPHAPTRARAHLQLGLVLHERRQRQRALEALVVAARHAEEGRADVTRLRALRQSGLRLADLGHFDEATHVLTLADGVAARIGLAHDDHEQDSAWGHLALNRGDIDESLARYERARHKAAERYGEDSLEHIATISAIAAAASQGNRDSDAEPHLRRAIALGETALGENPFVATLHHNLGSIAVRRGDLASARASFERALEIRRGLLGDRDPTMVSSLVNLGVVAYKQSEFEAAADFYTQAIEVTEAVQGLEALELAKPLHNLALVRARQGAHDEAVALDRRSLDVRRDALGEDHPLTAASYFHTGLAAARGGDHEAAHELYTQALSRFEDAGDSHRTNVAGALLGISDCLLALGRAGEVVEPMERALAIHESDPLAPQVLAGIEFNLAQALPTSKAARARGLAESAQARLREHGGEAASLASVEAWLEDHPAPPRR